VVDVASLDRAARHALVLGGLGVLHDRDAAALLDGLQAAGAVGEAARQDHTDGLGPVGGRQGPEEAIDRVGDGLLVRDDGCQAIVLDAGDLTGWGDVDDVLLDRHPLLDLDDVHLGGGRQQIGELALLSRIAVRDDDDRHARFSRQLAEQGREGSEPAGRGPDTDHGEPAAIGGSEGSRGGPVGGVVGRILAVLVHETFHPRRARLKRVPQPPSELVVFVGLPLSACGRSEPAERAGPRSWCTA
jgi:hypothetical protein